MEAVGSDVAGASTELEMRFAKGMPAGGAADPVPAERRKRGAGQKAAAGSGNRGGGV